MGAEQPVLLPRGGPRVDQRHHRRRGDDGESLRPRHPAGRGRKDIDVISERDFEELKRLALTTRGDEYGIVLETLLHFLGEEACRPGEAFALRWRDVDFANDIIRIKETADHKGRLTPPKNGLTREIVLFPETERRLLAMPRLDEESVFPSVRGRMMVASASTTSGTPSAPPGSRPVPRVTGCTRG